MSATNLKYIISYYLNTLFQFHLKSIRQCLLKLLSSRKQRFGRPVPTFRSNVSARLPAARNKGEQRAIAVLVPIYILDTEFQTLPLVIIFVLNNIIISSVTQRYDIKAELAYVHVFVVL
jgi:hypothetical protein